MKERRAIHFNEREKDASAGKKSRDKALSNSDFINLDCLMSG